MKNVYLQLTVGCLVIAAFLALLGWAGDVDYTDQVILRMSYEEYDTIKAKLTTLYGHEPSDRQIAHWWQEHHED